jgi:hypothetical protein
MKQLLSLTNYEYESGKLSAYETLLNVISSFPLSVVEDYTFLFFLHLTMKLSNESSSKAITEMITKILLLLFQKVMFNNDLRLQIENYISKWLKSILGSSSSTSTTAFTANSFLLEEGNSEDDSREKEEENEEEKKHRLLLLIEEEKRISNEKIELVIIGCKLVTIYLQSMIPNNLAVDNGKTAIINFQNLTKQQKESMKQFYSLLYNNLMIVLQFHFIQRDNSSPYGEDDDDDVYQSLISNPVFNRFFSSFSSRSSDTAVASFLTIPTNSKFWHVLYQLLKVFDLSYEWNSSFIDNFLLTIHSKPSATSMDIVSSAKIFFMEIVSELLLYHHDWIRSVSLQLLSHYLRSRLEPPSSSSSLLRLSTSSNASSSQFKSFLHKLIVQKKENKNSQMIFNEFLLKPNSLYQIGRKLCLLMNQNTMKNDFLPLLMSPMLLTLQTMFDYPELDTLTEKQANVVKGTTADDENIDSDNEKEGDDDDAELFEEELEDKENDNRKDKDDDDDEEMNEENVERDDEYDNTFYPEDSAVDNSTKAVGVKTGKRGINWMMNRLRAIGADVRSTRRLRVLKVSFVICSFSAFSYNIFLFFSCLLLW